MTSIYLILVGGAMAWLGWRLATQYAENKRLASLVEHQKKTVAALLSAVNSESELADKLKKISEAEDEEELTTLYNDIIK